MNFNETLILNTSFSQKSIYILIILKLSKFEKLKLIIYIIIFYFKWKIIHKNHVLTVRR